MYAGGFLDTVLDGVPCRESGLQLGERAMTPCLRALLLERFLGLREPHGRGPGSLNLAA